MSNHSNYNALSGLLADLESGSARKKKQAMERLVSMAVYADAHIAEKREAAQAAQAARNA